MLENQLPSKEARMRIRAALRVEPYEIYVEEAHRLEGTQPLLAAEQFEKAAHFAKQALRGRNFYGQYARKAVEINTSHAFELSNLSDKANENKRYELLKQARSFYLKAHAIAKEYLDTDELVLLGKNYRNRIWTKTSPYFDKEPISIECSKLALVSELLKVDDSLDRIHRMDIQLIRRLGVASSLFWATSYTSFVSTALSSIFYRQEGNWEAYAIASIISIFFAVTLERKSIAGWRDFKFQVQRKANEENKNQLLV